MKKPTKNEKRILKSLIEVWLQYNSWGSNWDKGELTHANMMVGEDACKLLEEYGLAKDNGYSATLTKEGFDLLNEATTNQSRARTHR